MTRIATLALNNLTLFHTLNTLSRSRDLQIQLASDKKAQAYAGIAPEAQARLFEPFTQADSSTTRLYGGTGRPDGPAMTIELAGGGSIDLPDGLGERYRAILFYRGHW